MCLKTARQTARQTDRYRGSVSSIQSINSSDHQKPIIDGWTPSERTSQSSTFPPPPTHCTHPMATSPQQARRSVCLSDIKRRQPRLKLR
mmetsp:Transcript_24135/g.69637  ORF Transcript_24135/g.69637 Transcript_24135/m.69637 type:complete len:89 (+) Transcript_24135:3047-3313(+)